MDAAQLDVVGEDTAGRDLLGAGDHDAAVGLLHHAGMQRRVALLVGRLAAVDLRRDDRVADVEVLVAGALVERDNVIGELLSGGRKNLRHRRIAGKEARHVVGRATHQPEGGLRPCLGEQSSRAQVGMRPGDLPGALHRLAGRGRGERHQLAVLRRRRDVVEARHRTRRFAEGGMLGDVGDLFAVDENLPPVVERLEIVRSAPHTQRNSPCY